MKALYRFYWDCGRQGDLNGIFVADDATVAACIGKSVHFGEVLGKHSDVSGTLESKDLTVLTTDPAFIEKFEEFRCASGSNPLSVIADQEADKKYETENS